MKLTDYIAVIANEIAEDGNMEVDRLIIDKNEFKLVIGENVYEVVGYKFDKKEGENNNDLSTS